MRYFQPQYNKTLLLLLLTVFRDLLLIDVLFSHEIRFHELRLVDLDIRQAGHVEEPLNARLLELFAERDALVVGRHISTERVHRPSRNRDRVRRKC